MSDTTTPRTDELAMNKSISQEDANELIWVLAKQLERELATATARVKELHGQVESLRHTISDCNACSYEEDVTKKGAK